MPADKEIHFGFIGPRDIDAGLKSLGLATMDGNGTPMSAMDLYNQPQVMIEADSTPIDAILKDAYEAVARQLGWTLIARPVGDDMLWIFDTPFGRRETLSFRATLRYDPDEIGDGPDDASFGIALSARYYPCVLDIESEHGTLGNAVDVNAMNTMIQTCTRELTHRLPALQQNGAKVFYRDIFY